MIPFLSCAVHEAVQESLGFSPAEPVFGHEYVAKMRNCLKSACSLAKDTLTTSQVKMKNTDQRALASRFQPPGHAPLVHILPECPANKTRALIAPEVCHIPYALSRGYNEPPGKSFRMTLHYSWMQHRHCTPLKAMNPSTHRLPQQIKSESLFLGFIVHILSVVT